MLNIKKNNIFLNKPTAYNNASIQNKINYKILKSDSISFCGIKNSNRNIFQKGLDFLKSVGNVDFSNFESDYKILENDFDYAVDVRNFARKIKDEKDIKKFYNFLYHHRMFTQEEKELFKKYFGEYLADVQSRQPKCQNSINSVQQSGQYEIISKKKSIPNKAQNPALNTVQSPKVNLKDSLAQEFDSLEKDDIPAFVAKSANGTREEQYALLDLYTTKSELHKSLPEKTQERLALGTRLANLRKQMEQQNISFVPKAPEEFTSNEEKRKYVNNAINKITKNEASAMEALDVFEKYGEKRFIDDKTSITSLEALETNVSCFIDNILSKGISKNIYHTKESIELTNTLLQRFIQVHSKYATNQVDSRSYPDVRTIWHMFSKYKSVANKDTILMMINAMKDLAVDKDEYTNLKYVLKHFDPMLYEAVNENNLQDIEKAIDEFGKAVENLPDRH